MVQNQASKVIVPGAVEAIIRITIFRSIFIGQIYKILLFKNLHQYSSCLQKLPVVVWNQVSIGQTHSIIRSTISKGVYMGKIGPYDSVYVPAN
jgi:hypothetical protein